MSLNRTNMYPAMGFLMALAGTLGFIVAGAWPLVAASGGHSAPGEVPAVSLVLILVGFICRHPTLLRDDTASVSAMRVVLFGLFCVFSVLTVKAGWKASDLSQLNISPGWAALLAAAIGGKAAQAFAEPSKTTVSTDAPPPPPKQR
jgi:hypothetical protein